MCDNVTTLQSEYAKGAVSFYGEWGSQKCVCIMTLDHCLILWGVGGHEITSYWSSNDFADIVHRFKQHSKQI